VYDQILAYIKKCRMHGWWSPRRGGAVIFFLDFSFSPRLCFALEVLMGPPTYNNVPANVGSRFML